MKRREFFGKTGCGIFGLMLAHFGLSACAKKEEVSAPAQPAQAPPPPPKEEMSRKDIVKKMLMEKKGMSEEEAAAAISDFEKNLPEVQEKCICRTCPTFVGDETVISFCQAIVGKSKVITEEKGCDCPKCPVYIEQKMKNGYYCTRKSEMEQQTAKTA